MAAAAAVKSLQSCPTLCDPIDGSPPGSPIPGILQARTLEWVAISFSNAWKWKVKVKSFNCVWLFTIPWTAAYQAPPSTGFSRQEYWSGLPLPSPIIVAIHLKTNKPKESYIIVSNIGILDWMTMKYAYSAVKKVKFLSSVQFNRSVVSDSLQPHGWQHARLPCPSPTPRAYSDSSPYSQWCHPAISSSVFPFFSCFQSFPASGCLPVSQFFTSGGQSTWVSALASVLVMNIQDWFLLAWLVGSPCSPRDSQESSPKFLRIDLL